MLYILNNQLRKKVVRVWKNNYKKKIRNPNKIKKFKDNKVLNLKG